MRFYDALSLSALNIVRNGHKSLLSVLSVAVGIFSLCMVSGLGEAASEEIYRKVNETGLRGITVYSASSEEKLISDSDMKNIIENIREIKAVTPFIYESGKVYGGSGSEKAAFIGVNQDMPKVLGTTLISGKYFSKDNVLSASKSAVIGDDLAQKLYHRTDIAGKALTFSINGVSEEFAVSAVIKSQKKGIESITQMKFPSIVYLPYTALNEITGSSGSDKIALSCFEAADENKAAERAARSLSFSHGIKYSCENINEYISELRDIVGVVKLFVNLIGTIALIAGGIGIMNSMFFMVDSRRTDIGIYLALGETRKSIMFRFLSESVLLCAAGGICGISAAAVSGFAASAFLNTSVDIPVSVFINSAVLAIICGIVFGVVPAGCAAKLDPIEIMNS